MKILSIVLGAVFAVGLAAAAYLLNRPAPVASSPVAASAASVPDSSGSLEERVLALEKAIAEERSARQTLEEELQALYAGLAGREETGRRGADNSGEPDDSISIEADDGVRVVSGRRAARLSAEGRTELLTEILSNAGFSPERAAWIVQREQELQLEAMQARFDAARAGEPATPFDSRWNPDAMLRAEIGDQEYERYLEAYGRPTAVPVGNVMQSSAADTAGLQAGDDIVRYDGQRVFSIFELNQQTMQGESGEPVVVDILRDGAPMQLVLPRGPMGIYTRGAGRLRP